MTTQSATLTFSLPEDPNSNFILVYEAASQAGSYNLVLTEAYEYGSTSIEFDQLDDVSWYAIRFFNSNDNEYGPISEEVYGGDYSNAAPFLVVSTSTDGANYATVADVYEYSHLTASDVNQSEVSRALRQARAKIDYRTSEMGYERFNKFNSDTARRKYNATLRLIKEAEINISLSVVYTNLSDDRIIENMRAGSETSTGPVSIGSTSLSGDSLADRNESTLFLAALAARYAAMGEEILASLDTSSIQLTPYDYLQRRPQFRMPFNGY